MAKTAASRYRQTWHAAASPHLTKRALNVRSISESLVTSRVPCIRMEDMQTR